uniref:Putative secreted protein n=1 Tax=Ixodes ricinus TaxID=34613 RepID=A0A6B0UFD0_IXORI
MSAGPERPLSKRSTMTLSFIGCCWRTAADSTRTVAVPLPGIPQPLLLKYSGAGAVGNEESAQGAAGNSFVPGHEGGVQQCQEAWAMHQGAAHRDCRR